MQEKIKEIIGVYIKLPAAQINTTTVIDRSAVSSSILLHRMYAKLAAESFVVKDYQLVKTFGDLLQGLDQPVNGNMNTSASINPPTEILAPSFSTTADFTKDEAGIGIDIEMVSAMPVTNDFREDPFYTMNFSVQEISYCILQPQPYVSFAGLFAAKEAIVKADNHFKKLEFKNISIGHLPGGKPFYTGFNLSVSHTNETAVAVAITSRPNTVAPQPPPVVLTTASASGTPVFLWLITLSSLLLSAIALFYIFKKA